jgi:transcriptional regulator with XRE-family HTH domain
MTKQKFGKAIRDARNDNALTQRDLAAKLGVGRTKVFNWETGKREPDEKEKAKLQSILGANFLVAGRDDANASSVLSEWLSRVRQEKKMTVAELAEESGLSAQTIYDIEAGKAQNPRQRTIRLLEKAVGKKFEDEFQKSLKEASTIEGLGEFQDFEPFDEPDWPEEPGIYVFYDISDRPVYVGMSENIARRIADHRTRFWFKAPIVQRAAYVPIKGEKLRRQVETILIKFLKSNAIINKYQVERD